MMDEWTPLPYSIPACRDALDVYLASHGFASRESSAADTKVTYSDGRTFVELSYWLEDGPRFIPMISMGIELEYSASSGLTRGGIGVWFAIPEEDGARHYSEWRFSTAAQLQDVLPRIRDEVLDVYARPLWSHPDQLAFLIRRQQEELAVAAAKELLEKKRKEAAAAFAAREYTQALDLYSAIGTENLTPVERKRVEIATRQAASSGGYHSPSEDGREKA
jgi:hypothetical protein